MADRLLTAADLIREAREQFVSVGIDSPGLDAEILLRETLQLSREQLLMRLNDEVSASSVDAFRVNVRRRLHGIPIAYITGTREFYGREFRVSPAVLVPRPETELLVVRALDWLCRHGEQPRLVIDVGTGSGAISVSIDAETNGRHRVIGSDVSLDALRIARENRDRHAPSVQLVAGSLLSWCRSGTDLVVANLPYLRPDQTHSGIAHEPDIALFAGPDGFALNRKLLSQAAASLASPGLLLMEIDPDQAPLAREEATNAFPRDVVEIELDLTGRARVLSVSRE